ncbi:MAG: galactokinase [Spirochaetia bacterium]|jgi:D-glycero-alpha-D-manno-heptose-7-phosphate kinase
MVITRSPLRVSLGGGGTDLPSYYEKYGGFLVTAAIDKYVYVSVTRPFAKGIYLKYSKLETVERIEDIQHPIIREALKLTCTDGHYQHIEITTHADIPAGTGLGSSGSFTTALLKALYTHQKLLLHADELARLACEIEIDRLKEPIGRQDQYISAYGGMTCFTFNEDGSVGAEPLRISSDTLFDLEDNLLLFFTGYARSAGGILKDQHARTQESDAQMLENLHAVKEMGHRSRRVLEAGKTAEFGALMHEHWQMKKRRSQGMTNDRIDEWYELGRANGAVGGKIVGAGGGGFLMFYAEDRRRLKNAMSAAGLEEVRFRFDFEGTKVLLS